MEKQSYDFTHAMMRPWKLPGGARFVLKVLFWVTLIDVIILLLFGRGIVSSYIELFASIEAMEADSVPDDQQFGKIWKSMSGIFLGVFLIGIPIWLTWVAAETALHKNAFRQFDGGVFPLRFGKDELRVLLIQLIIYALFLLAYAVVFLPFVLVAFLGGSAGLGALTGLWFFVGFIAIMIGGIYYGVKLSPASAMTVRDNEFTLFKVIKRTKGWGWSMLGTFVVITLVGSVVTSVISQTGVMSFIGNGSVFENIESGDVFMENLKERVSQPGVFIPLIILSLIYFAAQMLMYFHVWGVGNYVAELES